MLNNPWLDPRAVDWTDSFNPMRNPGWTMNNDPFVFWSLQEPLFAAIRNGAGIEPRVWVCPDTSNQLIQPNATFSFEVQADPNTWLLAVNASASGPGFTVQITDAVTGATVFSAAANSQDLDTSVSGTPNRGNFLFLSGPRLFVPPSYPVVTIVNTSSSEQTCRVNLLCAAELDLYT